MTREATITTPPLATVADHNAAFDPADETLGGAFRAGFREGWIYGQSPDGTDYGDLAERYPQAVEIEPSEAWQAHRDEFFAMLPLAAIPEVGQPLPLERAEVQILRETLTKMGRMLPGVQLDDRVSTGLLTYLPVELEAALHGRDRVVEALEKIAAFEVKPIRGTVSEQSATLGWNRAGEWAARVAASGLADRAVLHDAKAMQEGNGA